MHSSLILETDVFKGNKVSAAMKEEQGHHQQHFPGKMPPWHIGMLAYKYRRSEI